MAATAAQAAVAAALIASSLTMAPPAFGEDAIYGAAGEFTEANALEGGYRGSKPGEDKQIAAGLGGGAEKAENSKIQGGGASTLGSTLRSWPREVIEARSERVRSGGAPSWYDPAEAEFVRTCLFPWDWAFYLRACRPRREGSRRGAAAGPGAMPS